VLNSCCVSLTSVTDAVLSNSSPWSEKPCSGKVYYICHKHRISVIHFRVTVTVFTYVLELVLLWSLYNIIFVRFNLVCVLHVQAMSCSLIWYLVKSTGYYPPPYAVSSICRGSKYFLSTSFPKTLPVILLYERCEFHPDTKLWFCTFWALDLGGGICEDQKSSEPSGYGYFVCHEV
jgi:hypothetical protein